MTTRRRRRRRTGNLGVEASDGEVLGSSRGVVLGASVDSRVVSGRSSSGGESSGSSESSSSGETRDSGSGRVRSSVAVNEVALSLEGGGSAVGVGLVGGDESLAGD